MMLSKVARGSETSEPPADDDDIQRARRHAELSNASGIELDVAYNDPGESGESRGRQSDYQTARLDDQPRQVCSYNTTTPSGSLVWR